MDLDRFIDTYSADSVSFHRSEGTEDLSDTFLRAIRDSLGEDLFSVLPSIEVYKPDSGIVSCSFDYEDRYRIFLSPSSDRYRWAKEALGHDINNPALFNHLQYDIAIRHLERRVAVENSEGSSEQVFIYSLGKIALRRDLVEGDRLRAILLSSLKLLRSRLAEG